MRKAVVYLHNQLAGYLTEHEYGYSFIYEHGYTGRAVSLNLPLREQEYAFTSFPPFFEGLLPEGLMLDSLLRAAKLDRSDYLGQLIVVGADLPGAVEVYTA